MKNCQELSESNLPNPKTLCFIKRDYSGKESIYIGYRNGNPFVKDKHPSEDCHWTGRNVNEIDYYDNSTDFTASFSDVTVSSWIYVSDAVELLNTIQNGA